MSHSVLPQRFLPYAWPLSNLALFRYKWNESDAKQLKTELVTFPDIEGLLFLDTASCIEVGGSSTVELINILNNMKQATLCHHNIQVKGDRTLAVLK